MNFRIENANHFYRLSQEVRVGSRRGGNNNSRKEYLVNALLLYRYELEVVTENNKVSLWKNIGIASLKLAQVLDSKLELNLIIYHLSESINYLTMAWIERVQERKSEWGHKVEGNILECFQMAFSSMDGDVETERIPNFYHLDKIINSIGPDVNLDFFRAKFRLARAQYLYNCSVKTFEVSNFKLTDRILEYCRAEIEGARQLWAQYDQNNEIEQLQEDLNFIKCSSESVRLRYQADEFFKKNVFDSEETNFGLIWETIDLYKSASLSCREIDLENEAIALSRLGRVFDKILKLRGQAKKYYKDAFELGQSLQPRDLSRAKWFQECKTGLEKYQKEILEEERLKKEDERRPFLKESKTELEELQKISSSSVSDHVVFLKSLYATFPTKSVSNFVFDESKVNPTNMKKVLTKAIFHYHPDKQATFEGKWQVLCEEITKKLNARYETFKPTS